MDLCVERTIAKPFQLVEATLMSRPWNWLPGPRPDHGTTVELDVRLGASRVARQVAVWTGTMSIWPGEERCRLPIAWRATRHAGRYPSLTGTLDLERSAARRTTLTLRARYQPPAGFVGELADRAALHTIAEASVQAFMDRLAIVLDHGAMSRALSRSRRPDQAHWRTDPLGSAEVPAGLGRPDGCQTDCSATRRPATIMSAAQSDGAGPSPLGLRSRTTSSIYR
jgi:hypothetical protein